MNDPIPPRPDLPHPDAVMAEGPTLSEAVAAGASVLSLHASEVEYKLDMTHFRSALGRNVGVDTVKVFVWPKDQALVEATRDVREWLETLLKNMSFEGAVDARLDNGEVLLRVRTAHGRHLVGRQGATLDAVRTLLEATLGQTHPELRYRIDVADERGERGDRGDRGERRERRDERPRRDDGERRRGRDRGEWDRGERDRGERDRGERDRGERDHGERGDRRREGRGGRRERGPELKGLGEDGSERVLKQADLERLVQRLAQKVQKTGEPEVIRKELNGYARRFVHLTVQESFPGVKTESMGDGHYKKMQLVPADAAEAAGGGEESAD